MYRFYGEEATNTNNGYRAASFTIELRDTGRYGFELPPDQVSNENILWNPIMSPGWGNPIIIVYKNAEHAYRDWIGPV